jgi:hypothetical protein
LFAVVVFAAALLLLVRLTTVAELLIGLFILWWLLATLRDMVSARDRRDGDKGQGRNSV